MSLLGVCLLSDLARSAEDGAALHDYYIRISGVSVCMALQVRQGLPSHPTAHRTGQQQQLIMNSTAASSRESSIQQLQDLLPRCTSINDPQLQAALLRHPSISQDQQVVAKLLQTSKELQAAVRQCGAGQLPMLLQPIKLQQVQGFAQWLQKHGHLLRGLSVELGEVRMPRRSTVDAHGFMLCRKHWQLQLLQS